MKLSVNLNKVALLRNSRGGGVPDINYFANYVLDQDCIGITVHPRPDARHIDYDDIALLIETIYNINTTTEYKVSLKDQLRDLQKELVSIKKEQKDYMTEILGEIEENSQKTYD